jgi:hypothetical protein
LISCEYCLSFWVAFLIVYAIGLNLFPMIHWILGEALSAFVVSSLSNIFCYGIGILRRLSGEVV